MPIRIALTRSRGVVGFDRAGVGREIDAAGSSQGGFECLHLVLEHR